MIGVALQFTAVRKLTTVTELPSTHRGAIKLYSGKIRGGTVGKRESVKGTHSGIWQRLD